MPERDIGQEILEGIREIKRHKAGAADLKTTNVDSPVIAQAIRRKLNLSQAEFALLMGVSVRTLQDWEQGRRSPSGPARALLTIAHRNPKAFLDLAA